MNSLINLAAMEKALAIAISAHIGQTDKGGTPYICHLLGVWQRVRFLDEDIQVTAILHDVVEDTPVTIEDVRNTFGNRVADAVEALTRREGEKYLDEYIPRVAKNPIAISVKIADLLDNSDPIRGYNLPPEERESEMTRYAKALKFLRGENFEVNHK